MKALFPSDIDKDVHIEKVRFGESHSCDVYIWNSPDGIKIATHMIMSCPQCGYPLTLAPSEFNFEEKTLGHVLKCPARWKKTSSATVNNATLQLAELNEKGKPIIVRCGWEGYIVKGELVQNVN